MSLSAILTAATGTYFFVLPNELPMQKQCLGFLLTNYVTYNSVSIFICFINQFQELSGRSSEEDRKLRELSPSFWDSICNRTRGEVDDAFAILHGVPITALLLLAASTNAADHTMQMLAVAPFIPMLIHPLPIPYHRMVNVLSRVVTAIVGVGASVSMIKSEFF